MGELDLYLWAEQKHERIWDKLGAHPRELEGVRGIGFAVWAPNAAGVSVVGDFNRWDGRLDMMRMLGSSGVWEIFVPISTADRTMNLRFVPKAANWLSRATHSH